MIASARAPAPPSIAFDLRAFHRLLVKAARAGLKIPIGA